MNLLLILAPKKLHIYGKRKIKNADFSLVKIILLGLTHLCKTFYFTLFNQQSMKQIVSILFSFLTVVTWSSDSLQIVQLFNPAKLAYPDSIPTQKQVLQLEQSTPTKLKGLFYANWALNVFYQNNPDSTQTIGKKGLEICQKIKGSENYQIKIINVLASTYLVKQDYPNGIKYYEEALTLAKKNKDTIQIAYINLNIANLFFSAQEYSSAYQHCKIAFETIKKYPDDPYYLSSMATLGISETKIGKLDSGKKHSQKALEIATQKGDVLSTLISHHALGTIYLETDQLDESEPHLRSSLELAQKFGRKGLINLNLVALLKLYEEKGEYQLAIKNGKRALQLMTATKDKTKEYSIYKSLGNCYAKTGDFEKAFKSTQTALKIFREKNGIESQKAIQEIKAKYETERKDKLLAEKSLNLAEEKLKSTRFQNLIYILLAFGLASILVLISWRLITRQNRLKLEIQKEQEKLDSFLQGEEKERMRIATELHDGVTSDLTAIKYKIEGSKNDQSSTPQQLLNLLSTTQENVRRIAHNLTPMNLDELGLTGALSIFASEINNNRVEVTFIDETNGQLFSKNESITIYRSAQELIQNAVKHAKPSFIEVQLIVNHSKEITQLIVENDGTGFDVSAVEKSFGLSNLAEKARLFDGNFNIESSVKQNGAIAIFELPIKKT